MSSKYGLSYGMALADILEPEKGTKTTSQKNT